ncbi:unnamed protein product [Paramecium primaurelia]|uniref:non-specific serine/threonine protein kinase n=1 Tax=Paramecium primaurelia TaxID=5886 RepID=A0A8S1PWT3_PARPR|nr:unnamed protein product [Paramecium primaurelia]
MKPATYLKKVGPYSLIREIGQGSFARVFRGKLDGRQEDVAIKMISKQNVRNESMSMIEKEIEILRQLDHPNIIKLIDFKRTQNHYYLVFEYCENGDLDAYIRKYSPNGKLPEEEVRRIVQQLAQALQQMYKLRIVHRDLKLANILVSKNFQIKLADFGFAKYMEEDQYLTSYCGTPLTMAPEILQRKQYNEKCDVWSVGVIIYQMIYGRSPFVPPKGGNINDLIAIINKGDLQFPEISTISIKLKELLIQMLQQDFKKRISFRDFFEHIWLQGEVKADYIQSIKQDLQENSCEIMPIIHHKASEDIQEEEIFNNERDDSTNEVLKDQQLKYIGYQLQKQAIGYLDLMFEEIYKVKQLCDKIQNTKIQFQFLKNKLISLSLAIRIYEAFLLKQVNEFMKEQIVVLHTPSSNSSLISLQMKRPFQTHQIMLQKEIIELKNYFKENQMIINQFEQCGYCIADNIFDEILELLMNLIEHQQLIDQNIFTQLLQLLYSFIQSPPQLLQVELYMKLQTGNDMNYYWHLFKLVRVNQKYIADSIENQIVCENYEFDKKLQFEWKLVKDDSEETQVSFNKEEIDKLQDLLKEEYTKRDIRQQIQ